MFKTIHDIVTIISTACLVLMCSAFGWAQSTDEYSLKAALNYNFAKYTQWPETGGNNAVEFCFFNGSYKPSFEPLMGKTLDDKTIIIRKLKGLSEIDTCHLLYVDTENRSLLSTMLSRTSNKPILTVSDHAGFAESGGMIEIVKVDNRLRFKVNLAVLRENGISMSSRVLSLASEIIR